MTDSSNYRPQELQSGNDELSPSQLIIENRRTKVFDLIFMRGFTIQTTAHALNVHYQTISNDIKAIKENAAEMVKKLNIDSVVGEAIKSLQTAYKEAWLQYSISHEAGEKVKYFDLYLRAHRDLYSFLLDVGLIKRAPMTSKVEITNKKLEKMSDEELYAHRDELVEDLLGINVTGVRNRNSSN